MAKESLTYVKSTDSNQFYLEMYDPQKGVIILERFTAFVQHNLSCKNQDFLQIPAVRGYRFEELLLQELQELCVSAKCLNAGIKRFECEITGGFMNLTEPLKRIEPKTMYHLRIGHHSIDGLLLHDSYLFLIQVSLSSYAKHESKAISIQSRVPKEEDPSQPSIVEYYKKLATRDGQSPTPVYVFLSPKETGDPTDQFQYDLDRATTRQSSVTGIICCGLATSGLC